MMFPIISECGEVLQDVLDEVAEKEETLDAKEIIARFGTDIISSVAFGIQTNSQRNPNSEFREMGRKVFLPTFFNTLRNLTSFILPGLAEFFNVSLIQRY